jgi:ribose transport system permease protein
MMTRLYWHFRALVAATLAAIFAIVAVIAVDNFGEVGNLYALIQGFAMLSLVAAGLGVTMIAGEFDLSVAATFPLAGLLAVWSGDRYGASAGILMAVTFVLLLGLLNGALVAYFDISSLAVTIGTMVLVIGVGYAVAQGQLVTMVDFNAGVWLEQPIANVFSPRSIICIGLAVALAIVMAKTWFGRFVKAVGADRKRARELGVPVRTTLVAAFLVSALCAGVAGSLQGIALASGAPGSNEAFLLSAVTAAIVGGVALSGGVGTVPGVLAGAFLLTIVANSLSLAGTSAAAIQLTNGLILLLVVVIDRPLQEALRKGVERRLRTSDIEVDTSAAKHPAPTEVHAP